MSKKQNGAAADCGDADCEVMVQPSGAHAPQQSLDLETHRIALAAHDKLIADTARRIDQQRCPEIRCDAGPGVGLADRNHQHDDQIIDVDQYCITGEIKIGAVDEPGIGIKRQHQKRKLVIVKALQNLELGVTGIAQIGDAEAVLVAETKQPAREI